MGDKDEYPKLTQTSDIIYITSYIPRNCGIATFTYDLSHSITMELVGENSPVLALTNIPEGYNYPPEVTFEVRRNLIRDYARAAEYLNNQQTGKPPALPGVIQLQDFRSPVAGF